jgi:hypothetical protein
MILQRLSGVEEDFVPRGYAVVAELVWHHNLSLGCAFTRRYDVLLLVCGWLERFAIKVANCLTSAAPSQAS